MFWGIKVSSLFIVSHGRGIAAGILALCGHERQVEGTVKPGATFENVIPNKVTMSTTKADMIIILGGSNDVYSGKSSEFVKNLNSIWNH